MNTSLVQSVQRAGPGPGATRSDLVSADYPSTTHFIHD